jgi:hypothetical protein
MSNSFALSFVRGFSYKVANLTIRPTCILVKGIISDPGIGTAPTAEAEAEAPNIHLFAVEDFSFRLLAKSISLLFSLRISKIAFLSISIFSPVFEEIGVTL